LAQTAFSNVSKVTLQRISLATNKVVSKPTNVLLLVTQSCNLKCRQCDIPLFSDRSKELSTEQWKKILRQLHKWLGAANLRWVGGEPLVRKDTLELVEYGAELGMLSTIITNGQLIDEELAGQIVDAGTSCVSVSIDGMKKGHDFVRGEGTFEKAVAAACFLNEARSDIRSGIRIIINATIMDTNLDEILDLVEWAEGKGLNGVYISGLIETLETANPDPKWFRNSPLWVRNLERLDSVIDRLIEKSGPKSIVLNPAAFLRDLKQYYRDPTVPKPPDFTCYVGHTSFWVDPRGDVRFCPYIPSPIVGNIVESAPERIWKSPAASVSRKEIAACHKNCATPCRYERRFGEYFELFLKLFK
jgi:MoaA/NifB/PqqE/SkfB family radical SAM enzyme